MSALDVSDGSVRILARLFETRSGQQLTVARRWRIEAVLRPLLATHAIASLDELAARIASAREPRLADAVIEALLNNETSFFRDIATFRQIEEVGLERLRSAHGVCRRLRIWSAGCSTGQEAYSLAMAIADRPDRWDGWSIDILATDLSSAAIARARAGSYSQFEIQRGLPVTQMLRRFDKDGDDWQIDDRVRGAVRFQIHNLIDPPPPGPFDLILCRNVLLYFAPEMRRLVFDRIAQVIAPDGLLVLGAGETVMGQTDRFVSDPDCRGLYRPGTDAA